MADTPKQYKPQHAVIIVSEGEEELNEKLYNLVGRLLDQELDPAERKLVKVRVTAI